MTRIRTRSASNTCASKSLHFRCLASSSLISTHSYDLPKDVFVEGETKPTKKKTKKAKEATPVPGANPTQHKRRLSNAGFDVSSEQAQKMTLLSPNDGYASPTDKADLSCVLF